MSRSDERKRIAQAKRWGGKGRRAGSKKAYHKGCFGNQGVKK